MVTACAQDWLNHDRTNFRTFFGFPLCDFGSHVCKSSLVLCLVIFKIVSKRVSVPRWLCCRPVEGGEAPLLEDRSPRCRQDAKCATMEPRLERKD